MKLQILIVLVLLSLATAEKFRLTKDYLISRKWDYMGDLITFKSDGLIYDEDQ